MRAVEHTDRPIRGCDWPAHGIPFVAVDLVWFTNVGAKAMIHFHLDKWLIKILQLFALVVVYFATASATCQLLHSPEATMFRFFLRILSTI